MLGKTIIIINVKFTIKEGDIVETGESQNLDGWDRATFVLWTELQEHIL